MFNRHSHLYQVEDLMDVVTIMSWKPSWVAVTILSWIIVNKVHHGNKSLRLLVPLFHIYCYIYSVSLKKWTKVEYLCSHPYRIIIVSLIGRALSHMRFDILIAVVHQKAVA